MPRLLILIAAVPILITFIIRWWNGLRVISSRNGTQCSCDLTKWEYAFGSNNLPASSSGDLIIFAEHFRNIAMAEWRVRDPKTAISREATRRFNAAVPPLTAMVVIMAAFVARIPIAYAIAIFLLSVAFSASVSYLTLATEIKAILTTAKRLRGTPVFPRRDDEEAVIELAIALSWKEAAPPIYHLIQR
ncbi:MAG: hypothetical protein RL346_1060 [Verrucomicrobiota bacterium]|jgi:hypothetical protein